MSPSKSVTASEDATIASDKNPPGALKTSDIGEIPPVIRETPPVSRETHPVTVTYFSRPSISRVTIVTFLIGDTWYYQYYQHHGNGRCEFWGLWSTFSDFKGA